MANPGLYPSEQYRPTSSNAEKKLWQALKTQLPAGWYAWHSLKVRDAQGYEGEGDFVIADPARGFIVLEVKGGDIEVRGGHWLQNGKALPKSPRDQAQHLVRKLWNKLSDEGHAEPAYGVAVGFPDVMFDEGPTQGDLKGLVIGMQDLPTLQRALKRVMDAALPGARTLVRRGWVDVLHKLWCETWTPRLSLGSRAKLEELERVQFDAEQLSILDALEDNPRLLVTGSAGTGKTLLAMEAARRASSTGKRVLLLCFTDALAGWLAKSIEGSRVQVSSVRQFANALLIESGAHPIADGDSKRWENAPLDAAEALQGAAPRYDVVVIDEAQDFAQGDWMLVDALVGKGRLWAFRDPAQAFWSDRAVDEGLFEARYKLTRCYRNPDMLWQVARAYGGGQDIAPPPVREAVAHEVLRVVSCPSVSSVTQKVATEIQNLRKEGFLPSEIAIVSLHGQGKSAVLRDLRLPGVTIVQADDAAADGCLVADTFLRFKGLERKAVIVVDLPANLTRRDTRMHIAMTRALATVRVVAPKEDLAVDVVLQQAG